MSKKILSENETGEILIKGYNLCNGYYKIPDEKQPFDKDRYLHTGDLGYIDEDKYLILTGRLKDIIIRKGENISPAEIEKAFEKIANTDVSVEELIKKGLSLLARQ